MPGSIDQTQLKPFPLHPDGRELDRDTSFLLDIHGVEQLLVFHLALFFCPRHLEHAVRKGGFSVVDVGDNPKVSYFHGGMIGKREKLKGKSCLVTFLIASAHLLTAMKCGRLFL